MFWALLHFENTKTRFHINLFYFKRENNKNNATYLHWTVRPLRKPFVEWHKAKLKALYFQNNANLRWKYQLNDSNCKLFVKAPEAGKNGGQNERRVQTLDMVFEIYKSSVWIEMINVFFFFSFFFFFFFFLTNFIRYFRNKWIFSLLKYDSLKFWGKNQT